MSKAKLPERASLEYLKKTAKERLQELRRKTPSAKLADAQLAIAREYGFANWRELKAEIDRRGSGNVAAFFGAANKGNMEVLRRMLAADRTLAHAANSEGQYGGWTALHTAAQNGHLDAVKLLLEYGADPNAREEGDNTYPLHWAAASRHLEVVRALLDAGGDPHGVGDVHGLDAIGWATFYHEPGGTHGDKPEVAALLVKRGARHHIFSAVSLGDPELIRQVVRDDPKALERRTSRFEGGQTALHFAAALKRFDLLNLLIELGADLEAEDMHGHTVLTTAMMHGDRDAIRRLHAAGAKGNKGWTVSPGPRKRTGARKKPPSIAGMAAGITKIIPMIRVPDIAKTLDWYTAVGFSEIGRFPEQGTPDWGMLQFGKASFMLSLGGKAGSHDVTLWFYLEKVDELYQLLKARQIAAAQAVLTGEHEELSAVEFVADIHNPHYGGREFGIRDLNGYILYFRAG